MEEVLKKIYPYTNLKAVNDIFKLYANQGYLVANFIYFSIVKVQKLFESGKKTTMQKEYKKAIMSGDFLLPDGMALQLFYRLATKRFALPVKKLSNLNGTDFIPYFLDEAKKRYGSQRIKIFLYGAKPEIVQECQKVLSFKGFNVVYIQDGYSELDRKDFENKLGDDKNYLNILLVARSTVANPIQELWTIKNFHKIKENNLMVFTVGGLFDFLAASNGKIKGTQKRAPKFVRKIKMEWLWRLITDPRRNYQKVKNSMSLFPYIFKYLLLKKD